MTDAKLQKAIQNAIKLRVSGFHKLNAELVAQKTGKTLEDIAYKCYLRQKLACWGDESADNIMGFDLPTLEKELYKRERVYAKSNIIDVTNKKLKSKGAIVKIFTDEYGVARATLSSSRTSSGRSSRKSNIKTLAQLKKKKAVDWDEDSLDLALEKFGLVTTGTKAVKYARLEKHLGSKSYVSQNTITSLDKFDSKECEGRGKNKWTVDEIKQSLSALGLPTNGKKDELCLRLRNHLLAMKRRQKK